MVRIGKICFQCRKDKFKSQRYQPIPVCEIETGRRDISGAEARTIFFDFFFDVKMIEMADGERGGSLGGR